ncbi:unnamed protein product [Mycetohabitans rhizoxinica HKI 454]|uniref:Uncharacterized protein n=1 Tax=Mycetohabitans rhizoxinica (strain DSM 19002 / CIP 109453 / HKI 454) TaxID=882378 RepID=E5AM56_MYCRK|nr:unnamed protein product [Mycetohabitans rhizoxinica HKI 454]
MAIFNRIRLAIRECRLAAMAAAHAPLNGTPPGAGACTANVGSAASADNSPSSTASAPSRPRGQGAKNSRRVAKDMEDESGAKRTSAYCTWPRDGWGSPGSRGAWLWAPPRPPHRPVQPPEGALPSRGRW